MSIADKEPIISVVCLHFSVIVSLAELEQLKRGLQIVNFSTVMESHASLFKQVFLHCKQPITADFVQDFI